MTRRPGVLWLSLSLYGIASWSVVTAADNEIADKTPSITPAPADRNSAPGAEGNASAASRPSPALAPFELRLANARSVKIMSPPLGLELGMKTERAHTLLDKLSGRHTPPKEQGGEDGRGESKPEGDSDEHRILWQLARTEYSSVYVKADQHDAIIYIQASVRPGKEIPFAKIGELDKAPIRQPALAAWDVVRPNKPLYRVIASGPNEKATSITWLVTKRPGA